MFAQPERAFDHISIRTEPVDQNRWAGARQFQGHVNSQASRHYATLGAGPEHMAGSLVGHGGRLVAAFCQEASLNDSPTCTSRRERSCHGVVNLFYVPVRDYTQLMCFARHAPFVSGY
jgi:hypothetical protein